MYKKYDRSDIVKQGIQLFRQNGYAKTGIKEILKACNIPKGSFYNFFESKQAFAMEAIDVYDHYTLGMLMGIDENPALSPGDRIRKFFEASNQAFLAGNCNENCLLLSLATEVTQANDVFSERISECFQSYKSYLIKWIAAGQEGEEIRRELTPEQIANLLYDGYHGAVIRMKYELNPRALQSFLTFTLQSIYA